MAPYAWTPAEISILDQGLAAAGEQLGILIREFRQISARSGERQGMANVALALTMIPPSENISMLLAAVRRLSRQPGDSPV